MPPSELMFTMRPAPGLLHEQRRLLAAEKRGFQIHVVDEIPIGFGELQWIDAAETRGVVDQAVERSELIFHFAKHAPDVVDVFEIGLKQRRRSAFFGRGSRLFLRSAVVDGYSIAGLIEPQRDHAADALGRARHQYDSLLFHFTPPGRRELRLLPVPRLRAPAPAIARSSWPTAKRKPCWS